MNILLIGSGGREHALAWKIAQSPRCFRLYCAPGNAGISQCATCVNLNIANHDDIISFCRSEGIDLVVVGPEAPLVAGIVDDLAQAGITAFGPSGAAAQLEGSKGFTKDLCAEFNIPTAAYQRFTDPAKAKEYLKDVDFPIVVKADGLAAGKGVVIAETLQDAETAVEACFEGSFGEAGSEVVIEAFLEGEEASLFALCDGQTALLLGTAQDHKRVGDGDTGPNTGGMGAYSPAPVLSPEMVEKTMTEIIVPTLAGMHARGTPFKGILYAGLMITHQGPQLIEYNVRFGDPECQVIMPRLKSDLVELMLGASHGSLLEHTAQWSDDIALSVVMASQGYPGSYQKGSMIAGLDTISENEALIFHAGTTRKNDQLLATGGRVLNVTALGKSVREARNNAYHALAKIDWENGFYRKDIGWRAIARERS